MAVLPKPAWGLTALELRLCVLGASAHQRPAEQPVRAATCGVFHPPPVHSYLIHPYFDSCIFSYLPLSRFFPKKHNFVFFLHTHIHGFPVHWLRDYGCTCD